MATRKTRPAKTQTKKTKTEVPREEALEAAAAAAVSPNKKNQAKWAMAGWVLLLLGGLGMMLPEQMAPLLNVSFLGVSLQMALGVASVILALNFLLED